jgi:hypothetical protein
MNRSAGDNILGGMLINSYAKANITLIFTKQSIRLVDETLILK